MLANAVSVLDIFEKKHRLEIPLFQRQYVWNQGQQWEPLWEDISRKLTDYILGRKDGPVHFLGAMVLDQKQTPTTHVDKRQVIDGQQRLTTLQLFLAALRDFCREQKCEGLAKEFDSLTKNSGRMVDPATEVYKVWPTQRDRNQFRDVMDAGSRAALERKHPLRRLPRRRHYEPRPRMVEAYIFFYGQISEFFVGTVAEPPIEKEVALETRLDEALHALKSALQVVVIDLSEGDDAQIIFETLNARGAPLLPADLLRNFIFLRAARAGEQQEALYEKYWKPFDDPLWQQQVRQGRLIRPRSDLFMQHYLSSRRFDDIPVTHLFVEYKYWIASSKPFPNVAAELEALANSRESYRRIISSPLNTPLGAFGRFLDIFDVGTVSPLLMVILEASPPEADLYSMLRALESYILRRTICQLPTKAYNRVFLNLAAILKKDGVIAPVLIKRLSSLTGDSSVWPTDAVFGSAFTSRAGYLTLSQARVVYLLTALNDALHSSRSESVTINSALTVEHIMPQAWFDHWPLQSGAKGLTVLQRYLETSPTSLKEKEASIARDLIIQGIGNLTLLSQPLNSSVSNGPWLIKRQEIGKHSLLALNKSIVAIDDWNETAIASRASRLLTDAVRIWPGPMPQTVGK